MLPDQAAELRNLVRRSARGIIVGPAPVLLAVAGGKGGVGTTTLALNLALAISELGSRMVLADMNVYRADVAPLCGMKENTSVADILEARRDVHEALQAGPGGVQILPGVWAPSEPTNVNESAVKRLLTQLRRIGRHAEVVMLDVGSGSHDVMRQLWSACDMIVLVTTPDDVAIMDSYATIKTVAGDSEGAIYVALNQVTDVQHAQDAFARLAHSSLKR
jgi:flagellar biosynthesis protein FlhG